MNGTASVDEFRVDIDLETAQRSATEARDRLLELRERYDLSRWEYARTVRIAPTERAHSHPVLTLNGFHNADEDAFLSTYLHEQIHWGLDLHREEETERAIEKLRDAYPDAHRGLPETGDDEYTTYLHLVVNWLEIFAAAEFIGRERAVAVARRSHVYSWIYRTTMDDWETIETVLREVGVLPLPPAAADSRGE